MKKRAEHKIIISLIVVLSCLCISGCKASATEGEPDKRLSGLENQYTDEAWRSKGFVIKDTLFVDETQENNFCEVANAHVCTTIGIQVLFDM